MQKIILFITISLGLAALNGCSKTEETKTTVEIVVKDASGNKANWTVYQIGDTKFNLYGADPFFKDQQSVTDNNGLATFIIADIDFATGGQRTYYFFAEYSQGGVNKKKNVGITLSKGDKKSGTLLLN
ncbi:MAG: hypothetical protein MUE53_05995 [Chitinophagales bacterium]|jgi:hypothetical protein|nr:hypothetical protein [Chitinophagales bacterium]